MIILLNFNGDWLHHGALSELSHFGKAFYREIESGNHYNAGQKQIKNHDGTSFLLICIYLIRKLWTRFGSKKKNLRRYKKEKLFFRPKE